MINKFCKTPLWECSLTLADVAMGRKCADTVIKNAKLINVCTHEIIENTDVAIVAGRIAMVGNCSHCIGENTVVVDAKSKFLAPAFMDGHIHVESSMLSVGEYAKAVLTHGTSGIFADPHEMCNVVGLYGVKCMLDDAKRTPLKYFLTTPSCVPAVQGFEDTGSVINPEDIRETMSWDECVGLGEMMNFPGINFSNPHTHAIVGETLKAGKIPTGHYSISETDKGLNAYISSGVRCCHESTTENDALEKMRRGMYAMLREGSAWHDLKEVSKAVTNHSVDSRYACLITDDTHPNTLISKGHLDYVVKRAIEEGIDPITAIQMVTINVAQCFHLDHEMGSIAPGKCADLVLISDLEKCVVDSVFVNGEHVAENGKLLVSFKPYSYPADVLNTIHLDKITTKDLKINAQGNIATVHAIEIISGRVGTFDRIIDLPIQNGEIKADKSQDVLKAVVFERHKNTGTKGFGFVKGFGIKEGALAQTVAHDAHNLFVVGSNDEDMALAVNTLIDCGGGMVAVKNGKILGKVELPVAGLMNTLPLEEMASSVEHIENVWKEMGSTLPSPFMTMAIIPLACLPELRLTNRGLVDCTKFEFTDLIIETK